MVCLLTPAGGCQMDRGKAALAREGCQIRIDFSHLLFGNFGPE
jgi:hypothetical protein